MLSWALQHPLTPRWISCQENVTWADNKFLAIYYMSLSTIPKWRKFYYHLHWIKPTFTIASPENDKTMKGCSIPVSFFFNQRFWWLKPSMIVLVLVCDWCFSFFYSGCCGFTSFPTVLHLPWCMPWASRNAWPPGVPHDACVPPSSSADGPQLGLEAA